jgi:hypothetical protein
VSEVLSARFNLVPDLAIEDEGTVKDSCYRRLIVRAQEPKHNFLLYLSPEERFVAADLKPKQILRAS